MPLVASVVAASNGDSPWSWNLASDVRDMFAYPFMVNAFRAGTIVAILGAIVGWYMVLRKQTFAGHTLSVAAFPGAAAATLIGISATVGYFAFCLAAALVIAIASRPSRGRGFSAESAVVGTVQAFVLASGYLFATLYNGLLSGLNNQLFGFTFGITDDQVVTLAAVAAIVLAVLAVVGRRLFFASIDTDVADARGVGVRLLGVVFLLVLGAAAAEASLITGALLVFALLVMPAAVAQRVTARPVAGIVLAVLIGVVATWAGLTMAYYTSYPSGFCITTFAFAAFVMVHRVRARA
ncbi:MAG TPA: metal ABC transporter permease [Acidothermaceae bacterium]|nr:metal ABC transporter permease [Acidothermaceae bacterium]